MLISNLGESDLKKISNHVHKVIKLYVAVIFLNLIFKLLFDLKSHCVGLTSIVLWGLYIF